ncbi:MAG: hypothetical protein Q4D85_06515 [Corynebacterium sp.]|uniref:hypothetical protein n=1 Tax=Corynebacterium sp. TaxID=1720 RepID=UPI0026DB9743|nr:hypothetical protein [Corynebacterium sp.]MDO5098398.1 hypothetical protein [Corynebacterium sp.]
MMDNNTEIGGGAMEQEDVSVDLHVLLTAAQLTEFEERVQASASPGFEVLAVFSAEENFSCEPDNMLVAQYEQRTGKVPVTEAVYRVVVHGRRSSSLVDATAAVADQLPADALWYGTTVSGWIDPDAVVGCALGDNH